MEISFARDYGAVLRKHWNGEIPSTKEHFSYENPDAKPEMLVWNIGYVTREQAKVFLQKWEEAFLQKGYQIIGNQLNNEDLTRKVMLRSDEERRLKQINPDTLAQGVHVQKVICKKDTREKKGAAQKYTVDTADEVLNIRTTYTVAKSFRKFCEENSLTQSQGLAMLIGQAKEERELLHQDLLGRLRKADKVIVDKEKMIQELRKELREQESFDRDLHQIHAARIQNVLLREFFARLPKPVFEEGRLKRYSANSSRIVFQNAAEYHFPEKEGVYLLFVDHVRYTKGRAKVLILYGRTQEGEKLKLCYNYVERDKYGRSLWDSPYLIQDYPWLFGVQKKGEFGYIIGALPLFDPDRIMDWYGESDDEDEADNWLRTLHREEWNFDDHTEEIFWEEENVQKAFIDKKREDLDELVKSAEKAKRK